MYSLIIIPKNIISGRLSVRIPWKTFFASEWVIEIDDILLVAVPNQQVQYDPEKEEKSKFEAKMAELQVIEEAKKAEAAQGWKHLTLSFIDF